MPLARSESFNSPPVSARCRKGEGKAQQSDRGSQAPCKGLLVWLKDCKGCKDSTHELYTFLRSSMQSLTLILAAWSKTMAV